MAVPTDSPAGAMNCVEWEGIQIERKDTGCDRDGFRLKEQESPVCSENGEPVQMLTVGIAVRGVMDP